ncbi:MAG: DUF814 domain-containing protein [Ignavibacteria bacterium]|nr:DUF814 domain-containing protein [Ignavibacteria bacterium]
MIRHALTLEHVARALSALCCGCVVTEAWTQLKGACLLRFEHTDRDEPTIVCIDTDKDFGAVTVRDNVQRARRNSFDLFRDIIGLQCTGVTSITGDRVLIFRFEDFQLCAMLFTGVKANVVLLRNNTVIDAMHGKKLLVETQMDFTESPIVLGRYYTKETEFRSDVIKDCRRSEEYYVLENGGAVLFSLLPLHGWTIKHRTLDIFDAIGLTISRRRNLTKNLAVHTLIDKSLNRERQKLERSIAAMKRELESGNKADEQRRIGHLLLSFENPAQTGTDRISMTDWNGETIIVETDPNKTVIENSQMYFEKARKSEAALKDLQHRLPATEKRLKEVCSEIERMEHTTEFTARERMTLERDVTSKHKPESPYRVFEIDEGYTVYVGRNAANNDELTMRFAKQNDWWFHARGESGSHVVLRGGTGKEKPPKRILERAAEIAAWYSGSRNATWTPVVYTQRKNVRKPKGANVGAVVLDREEVIMVKPGLPVTS